MTTNGRDEQGDFTLYSTVEVMLHRHGEYRGIIDIVQLFEHLTLAHDDTLGECDGSFNTIKYWSFIDSNGEQLYHGSSYNHRV